MTSTQFPIGPRTARQSSEDENHQEEPFVLPRRTRIIPLDAAFFDSDEEPSNEDISNDICCRCCFPSLDDQIVDGGGHPSKAGIVKRTTVSLIETIKAMSLLFWLVCVATVLTSYAYFAMAMQLTSFFSQALGYGDDGGARIYGYFGLASAVWITIIGPVTDRIGAPATLSIGVTCSIVGRILLVLAGVSSSFPAWLSILALIVFVALGDGSSMLAAKVLVTPLVSKEGPQRKIAFGILYSSQNIGAMLAGFSVDLCTWAYSAQAQLRASVSLTRFLVASTLVPAGLAAIITVTYLIVHYHFSKWAQLRKRLAHGYAPPKSGRNSLTQSQELADVEPEGDESGDTDSLSEDHTTTSNSSRLHVVSITPSPASPSVSYPPSKPKVVPWWERFVMTLVSGRFWRFVMFTTFCIGAKTVFRYLDMIYPIYMRRTFGPNAPVGTLFAIDPIVVSVLAPLAQAFTADFSPMRWIALGTWISCLSCLILAFSTPNLLNLYGVAFFGIVLAVGEALWSPRLDDYTADLSGSDRLGLFMALTTPIMFLSKLPASWISAWLLSRYCPSDSSLGSCDTIALWGIIGVVSAVSSPLMLTIFHDVVYDPAVRQRWVRASQRAAYAVRMRQLQLKNRLNAKKAVDPTLNVNTTAPATTASTVEGRQASQEPLRQQFRLSLDTLSKEHSGLTEEINASELDTGIRSLRSVIGEPSKRTASTRSETNTPTTTPPTSKRRFYIEAPWGDETRDMDKILTSSRSETQRPSSSTNTPAASSEKRDD